MNLKHKIVTLIPIIFLHISCDEDNIDYSESTTGAKEVSVPNSAKRNEQFSIEMIVYGSNGCSEFSRFETSIIGDTTIFGLYQRHDENLICTTAIIEIETSIIQSFEEAGTKYLVFNRGTELEIIDSIRIEE